MARREERSLLRRRSIPAGCAVFLCGLLAGTGSAATPSPDPPPLAVAPDAPAPARTQSATVQRAPDATAAPSPSARPAVRRTAPVVARVTTSPAKPQRAAKVSRPAVRHRAQPVVTPPHDRARVPLAAFVAADDALDGGLLAVAGIALLLVAGGGLVVLVAARRELRELAT